MGVPLLLLPVCLLVGMVFGDEAAVIPGFGIILFGLIGYARSFQLQCPNCGARLYSWRKIDDHRSVTTVHMPPVCPACTYDFGANPKALDVDWAATL